jgi:acyl carrier protein
VQITVYKSTSSGGRMSILDELKKIIARITHSSADEISLETALKDINADSLHWVQIIIAAEDALNIEIDIDKVTEFTTIGDFVNYIESLVK